MRTVFEGCDQDVTRRRRGSGLKARGHVHWSVGLIYFNARYYDPAVGRFVTEDPAKKGASWFSYCGNNPINAIDQKGMADNPAAANMNASQGQFYHGYSGHYQKGSMSTAAKVAALKSYQDIQMKDPWLQPGRGGPNHYGPNKSNTWCNIASLNVNEATGVHIEALLDPEHKSIGYTTATEATIGAKSQMKPSDTTHSQLVSVSGGKAFELAKQGFTVTGMWEDPSRGEHMATVRPTEGNYDPAVGPTMANVGGKVGIMSAYESFGVTETKGAKSLDDIRYYYDPKQNF